jgi:DNA-binding CsgD family transcriptional regulator
MEASQALDRSGENDIAPAVLAIGRPSFPQVLIDTMRRIAGVGHCMVFTFADERSARCLLDIGNIPIGPDLGSAYSTHFHLADPNRDRIFRERATASPIALPAFARRMYSARYAKIFFEEADIVDKFATAIWVDGSCFYVNFYRTVEQGRFSPQQVERLSRIAPGLGAAVARHFQAQSPSDDNPFNKLGLLFSTCGPLTRLTRREKEVCLRILSGFSSEAISVDLGISLQSTFTYRKRAYVKLGISSQNELFAIVVRLLASPHRLN